MAKSTSKSESKVSKDKNISLKKNNVKDIKNKNNKNKIANKKTNSRKVNEKKSIFNFFNKFKKRQKKIFVKKIKVDLLDVLLIIAFTAIICCFSTGFLMNYQYKRNRSLNESLLYSEEFTKFVSVYNEVKNNYYETINEDELADAALNGMMSYLGDKYSIYLSGEDGEDFSISLNGSYDGIGIVSSYNQIIYVYDDSPAMKSGLKVGDVILEVNGTVVTEDNYVDLYSEIRNSDKDNNLKINRSGEIMNFVISNDKVVVKSVSSEVMNYKKKKIGYIDISSFSSNTYDQFVTNLSNLEKQNIDSLVIDLRNNGGGYLDTAYKIAGLFVDKGKVIYKLKTKDAEKVYKDDTKDKRDYKIVVLINGGTASASEVLTSALKDSYGATIVGEKSFGKGKVQTYINYGDSLVKYTSALWLRPNGECIDGIGIKPDYEVKNTAKGNYVYDNQLEKALDLLSA